MTEHWSGLAGASTHGVAAAFESPSGKLYDIGGITPTPMHVPPSRGETDRHFASFDRCHSHARAEKDLIVKRALRTWKDFRRRHAGVGRRHVPCAL
ncbi:MAG: hypothetical protein OXN89_01175 [Bryobacterales bacterium]|nr:hypothetical protein [Bryobacterales bacterium]